MALRAVTRDVKLWRTKRAFRLSDKWPLVYAYQHAGLVTGQVIPQLNIVAELQTGANIRLQSNY